MRALIIVDVQNDFCPGGPLATADGNNVARRIATFVKDHGKDYSAVVATKDWHIDPGEHFSPTPDFLDTWPVHCVANSDGADFHPMIDPSIFDAVFLKGQYTSAYSGFEGATEDGTLLATWLRDREITHVDIAGIATDYCVRATALDALGEGFTTHVLTDLCAAVAPDTGRAALEELAAEGANVDKQN